MDPDAKQRGLRAKELLESEMFRESVASIRAAYVAGALRCDPRDDIGRFRYIEGLRIVDAVEKHLSGIIQTGDAAAEIEKLARPETVVERIRRSF
mgnify:CR=1 FL=1